MFHFGRLGRAARRRGAIRLRSIESILCPQLLVVRCSVVVLLWIQRLMMILILLLKLLPLLMLQQLLLPLHVIRMMHFPAAVCCMHATLLPAPVIPAPVPDLLCASHDAMLRPRFRRPAADGHPGDRLVPPGLHVRGRLVHPGLCPMDQLGVAALLPLPRHRLALFSQEVLLVVFQVVMAMQVRLRSVRLRRSGVDGPRESQGNVGGRGRLLR